MFLNFLLTVGLTIPTILQAQFSQMRPVPMPPNVGPRVPIYPPGAPGIGQQLFYGQAPPTLIPPQVKKILI